jgi:mono/diheme cytochrome c family protein
VSAAKLRAAAELYRINCLVCHGPDGRGTVVRAAMPPIPDFTTREWQSSRGAAQLSVSILEGKGALMPPWHGKISPEQARDLVAFVRTFGPADLVTAEAPASVFGHHFRELSKQWADLDQQVRSFTGP